MCSAGCLFVFISSSTFLQVINILVKSLRNSSGDNIALLLKQVDVIARFYQDRLISSSNAGTSGSGRGNRDKNKGLELAAQYDRLQVVAEVAQEVLAGLIKTQENVQPYLG